MRYVVDIDGTICIPGPTDETRYDQALPIQDRIDEINKLWREENIPEGLLQARIVLIFKNGDHLFKLLQTYIPNKQHL